jgi:hypothetical protein
VRVRPDGSTQLVSFSDAGHLPPALQSYPRPARSPAALPDTTASPPSRPGR